VVGEVGMRPVEQVSERDQVPLGRGEATQGAHGVDARTRSEDLLTGGGIGMLGGVLQRSPGRASAAPKRLPPGDRQQPRQRGFGCAAAVAVPPSAQQRLLHNVLRIGVTDVTPRLSEARGPERIA